MHQAVLNKRSPTRKPIPQKSSVVSAEPKMLLPPLALSVGITYDMTSHSISAMFDSGSAGSLIGIETATRLQIPLLTLHTPLILHTINSGTTGEGKVTHYTPVLNMRVGCLHTEAI